MSLANLSLRVNNLKPYTNTTSKGQEFIDLKFKLLPSTSKLQICTLNGTVIYVEYAQTVKRTVNGTVPVVLRTVQLSIKNIRKSIDKIYFLN